MLRVDYIGCLHQWMNSMKTVSNNSAGDCDDCLTSAMQQSVRIVRNGFGANINNNNNNNNNNVDDDRDCYMNFDEFASSQSDGFRCSTSPYEPSSNVLSPKQGFNRISVASSSSGGSSSGYASSSSLVTSVRSPTAAKSPPAWKNGLKSKLSASVEEASHHSDDDDYVVPLEDESPASTAHTAIPAWKTNGKLPVVKSSNARPPPTSPDGNLSDYENLDELNDAPRSVTGVLAKFGDRKPARKTPASTAINNKKTTPVTPPVALQPPNSPPPGSGAVVPSWKKPPNQTGNGNGTQAAAAATPKFPAAPVPAATPAAPWLGRQKKPDSIPKSASEGSFLTTKKQPPPAPAKPQPATPGRKFSGPAVMFPKATTWGKMQPSVAPDSEEEDEQEYVDKFRPSAPRHYTNNNNTTTSSSSSAPASSTYEQFPSQDDEPPESDAPPPPKTDAPQPPKLWGPQVVRPTNTYRNADDDTGRKFAGASKPVPIPPIPTETNDSTSPLPVFSPPSWTAKVKTPSAGRATNKPVEQKPSPAAGSSNVRPWMKKKTSDGGSSGAESNDSGGSMPPPLQPRVVTAAVSRVPATSNPSTAVVEPRPFGFQRDKRGASDGSTTAAVSSIAARPQATLPPPEKKSPKKSTVAFRFPGFPIGKGRNPTNDVPQSVYEELPDDDPGLSDKAWFFDKITREQSDLKLNRMLSQDGVFLVRERETSSDSPYSMDVVCRGHIYHLLVRQRSDDLFAIGYEKPAEKKFESLEELVSFYKINDLEIAGKNGDNLFVKLKKSPAKTKSWSPVVVCKR